MKRKIPLAAKADPDSLLWLRLKTLSERGWHFRRKARYRTFLLPFVEHDALLVVELDEGRRHVVRDRLLREAGYTILRYPRADAVRNLPSVIAAIRAVLEDRAC